MKPIQTEKLPWRVIESRGVILNPKRSEVHEFNETATMIWQHIDGQSSAEQIAEKLCSEFEVESQQALSDVHLFLKSLENAGLIEWKS